MSLRNFTLNFNDVTKVGLTLNFVVFSKVSDNLSVTPPVISELSSGFYKFSFDMDIQSSDIYYVVSDGGVNILTGVLYVNTIDSITDSNTRVLGLSQENQFIDNAIYDGNNNLTSARLRIYSQAIDVGTPVGVIATYTIETAYIGTEMSSYSVKLTG